MVVLSWVMIMRPIVPPTSQPGTNEIHVPACGVPGLTALGDPDPIDDKVKLPVFLLGAYLRH
jgi:hypothetical protein